MPNVAIVVRSDEGQIIADYPLSNGDVAECLADAADLREQYRQQTGIELEPTLEPR